MLNKLAVIIMCSLVLSSCAQGPNEQIAEIKDTQVNLAQVANAFFAIYAKRQDTTSLLSFYADEAEIQDLVYGELVKGKPAITHFYDWHSGNVKLLENDALKVTNQITQGNVVVTRGYFTPFLYYDQPQGPWRFVIWLEFNQEGKIVKQYDWINYTPKETFIGGENLNQLN